jgi:hypothetical protein
MTDALTDYLSDDSSSYFTDEEWNETPREREARKRKVVAEVPKGTCPTCGKHIGRGLHFHMKACKA